MDRNTFTKEQLLKMSKKELAEAFIAILAPGSLAGEEGVRKKVSQQTKRESVDRYLQLTQQPK